nr:cyclophane-forming radical SAM/SPASM peptide maturase YhhB [Shewanella algae]
MVKVASRCNLDCDYCYMYHHEDQSWRSMPKTLSAEHREAFTRRLQEYVLQSGLNTCSVIFHGGEPLLAGAHLLSEFAAQLRAACSIPVDVSIQTNGLLLSDATLELFEKNDIGVSLSLDGPKSANDKHRLTRKGRSSFAQTERALERLQKYPSIFAGVIAVIDVSTSAEELFEYFAQFKVPRLDFLLPDAHWLRRPPGRDQFSNIYEEWLVDAFDVWLERYPHIPLRTFEALLDACAGLPSGTDAFGFGDVSLLSIETDGSYHDLDVLKVTKDGATKLVGNVIDTPIAEVARSPAIERHRRLLRKDGLAEVCQNCRIVEVCGGGALPHRFGENGFSNPTVYCNEMMRLVTYVKSRLEEHLSLDLIEAKPTQLPETFALESFELAETSKPYLSWLRERAEEQSRINFNTALQIAIGNVNAKGLRELNNLEQIAVQPGAIAWSNAVLSINRGHSLLTVDGIEITASPEYLEFLLSTESNAKDTWDVGCNDLWLRAPFGKAITFESDNVTSVGQELVRQAMAIVNEWRPALATEMLETCHAVQFIRDPKADPNKIVSFSDNSVPGVLYVSITQEDGLIDPYDLADSLIHEHRHQKLYLLERYAPTVHPNCSQVSSPWREDLRPPSGLFHAVFVFVELRRYWIYVREHGPDRLRSRAVNQIADTDLNLKHAFITLEQCPLTQVGQSLVEILKLVAQEGNPIEFIVNDSTIPVVA